MVGYNPAQPNFGISCHRVALQSGPDSGLINLTQSRSEHDQEHIQ